MAWNNIKHVSTATRNRILNRDGHQCSQCGSTDQPLEIDHTNNARGPHYDQDANLQVLCKPCHRTKTDWESQAWRRKIKRQPRKSIGLA